MVNPQQRLVALDAFRGATIALMILVNTPGSWSYVYSPLRHAEWHGCTPTDLVFPFFLFIVGVAMRFSFKRFNYTLNRELALKILKRTAIIFWWDWRWQLILLSGRIGIGVVYESWECCNV